MSTFLVVDNVLEPEELLKTKEFFKDLDYGSTKWINKEDNVGFPLDKILNVVSKTFDLSAMVGCECWSHVNTRTPWHVDKDETAWENSKELKHPLCSIVYYTHIKDLRGGRFVTKSHLAIPKENRLVAFSPGLSHAVEVFKGERMACAINPWAYQVSVG